MIYNIKSLKTLRKFNLNSLIGFTTKINLILKKKIKIKEYRLPIVIKLLKIIYKIKNKKLKYYFNKFLFINLYNFLKILKLRLDFALVNFNLFLTLNQVKQNISHNHILLNNKIEKRASYCLKNNDIIHFYNISINTMKKLLVYNYIIRNINIYTINKKIYKYINFYNTLKKIPINLNINNFDKILCTKKFKIKINKNNLINLHTSKYLNCKYSLIY